MNCYACETKLIVGGDDECEGNEDYSMVTNLSCPECDAFYLIYWPKDDEDEQLLSPRALQAT